MGQLLSTLFNMLFSRKTLVTSSSSAAPSCSSCHCEPSHKKSAAVQDPDASVQVNVKITNSTSKYTFISPQVYIYHGNYDTALPPELSPSETGSALFTKTNYTGCGSEGVFTYDIVESGSPTGNRMAVMFCNPNDHQLFDSWFAVGLFDQSTPCNEALYNQMYGGDPTSFVRSKAKDPSLTYRGSNVTIDSFMTTEYVSTLYVDVTDS